MRSQTACIAFLLVQGVCCFTPAQQTSYPKKYKHERSRRTPLSFRDGSKSLTQMEAIPQGAALAAIGGTCAAGMFSGGLHAIAGPDHLAALIPRCCGQRWFWAGRVGALWGMGHGISATLIGVLAFGLKNRLKNNIGSGLTRLLSGASHMMEVAVGLSIIIIGFMGMKEAREYEIDTFQGQSLSAAVVDPVVNTSSNMRAVIFNGILHGFSWDGAPSLAPALAVATWAGSLSFLASYAVGTITAMAIATTLIGEGTRRAGKMFNRPDIPQKLSLLSSLFAIVIGAVWCGLALI